MMELVTYEWDAIPYPATLTLTAGAPFTAQDVRARMVIYTDTPADTVIDESCLQDAMELVRLDTVTRLFWDPETISYTTGPLPYVHYKVQSKGNANNIIPTAAQFTLSKECP